MADQPRNVRDADEDAKPQPGAAATDPQHYVRRRNGRPA
nr:MAG TPA: hypothetical protein [Caudoviricetes sp.]